jgi:hypothetical protein
MRHVLGILVALVLLAVAGNAQTFRGAINGTVTDPSGAVVTGANVKATNTGTGVAQTSTTTGDGEFSFQDLPLGTYKIEVSAPGFRPATFDNVSVTAGSAYTLPVKLSPGSAGTTVVEVSAAALVLDTTTATQDNVIPTEQVQNVPMNGRDFTQFTAAAPGYAGYSGAQAFGSLNGTRANQMNWQIDGVDNNDFWHNLAAVNQGGVSGIAGTLMPLDAIDEFAAQTQSNAEAGRNAGGVINVVLKSGSNQIHGSAYYFNRNTSLGAATPFFNPSTLPAGVSHKKPPLRNENYGFSLGGPIVKDKAFWFVGFEKQKYTIALSGLNTEPSTAYQNDALALVNADLGKLGPSGALDNGPNPISTALMQNLWPSLIDNLPASASNYFATNPSLGYSYNGVVKLDYNFNEKNHLSARWFGGQGSQTAPTGASAALATASSNLPFYFEKAPIHVFNYAVTLNSVFTPRMTNQLLVGVNYFNQVFRDAVASYDTHTSAQLFLSPDTPVTPKFFGAPNIRISGFEQVGITPPEGRNDITGMIADVVSYNTGKHQLRFGGEYRQAHLNEFYFFHSLGKFVFSGAQGPWNIGTKTTPNCVVSDANVCALADFLAGFVDNSAINAGNAERKIVVNALDFFGSDAWQVTRRLNLNLGLRWDYFGPLHNGSKDIAIFVPGRGIQIQGNGLDGIFQKNLKNFSPRLGFAYQPTSREDLVVRGGFGIYFDQINVNPFMDVRPPNNADGVQDNPAGPSPVSIYTQNTLGQTSYTWQPGQYIFNPVQKCPSGNVAIDPSCGTSVFDVYSVNQNFHTAYFFNYNLNVQKSFGNGAAVWQVGYVGSEGRRLSVLLNINQPVANTAVPGTFILPFNSQYPNFGAINQLNSIGTSNYNALQSTLRLRAWHGLSSQLGYTWAHNLDEISAYRGVIPFDSYNIKADYGNSDFDTRHTFTGTLSWDVPGSAHGPKALTHGWNVSTVLSFHGGQPNDQVRQGLNLIGDPFGGVSHSFVKNATFTGEQWVNPAAFGPASCFQVTSDGRCYGTLQRNAIHGPGYSDVDLGVGKSFVVTERLKAQFKAELFNLFNRINLASGPGAFGYSAGQVTDTIGDFNGAPGIGPGEAFNTVLSLKLIF